MDRPTGTAADAQVGAVPATPLSPRVVVLWRARSALVTASLLLPATLFALLPTGLNPGVRALVPLTVLVVGGVLTWTVPTAQHRRWRYTVTVDVVELRHGLVVRRESSIPHFRVQHIDLQQGPLDRWLGIVRMRISTASPATDADIPGIEPARAEQLRSWILARAEADDGV
jgi:uncharacterized protein